MSFKVQVSGGSAVWLAHLLWEQRVVGSNPTRPTTWHFNPLKGFLGVLKVFPVFKDTYVICLI